VVARLSEEKLSGIVVAEKIFGVIIIIIGILMTYNTYNEMKAAGLGATVFLVTAIALIILGLIVTTARPKS